MLLDRFLQTTVVNHSNNQARRKIGKPGIRPSSARWYISSLLGRNLAFGFVLSCYDQLSTLEMEENFLLENNSSIFSERINN
jgi:hypothetical protein